MGGVGPVFRQMGFFVKFAGSEVEDTHPYDRYLAEVTRLQVVVITELKGKDWITGDFSIADIALAPELNVIKFHDAQYRTVYDKLANVSDYLI
jgi:GST-like protein